MTSHAFVGRKECKRASMEGDNSQNCQICRWSRNQCYVDGKILRDRGGQEVSIQRWIEFGIEKKVKSDYKAFSLSNAENHGPFAEVESTGRGFGHYWMSM